GSTVWDLYGGVGVFAAAVADEVGPTGVIESVEFSSTAVQDGKASLSDLQQVRFHGGKVERTLGQLASSPQVVILDPPRSGAGKEVIAQVAAATPERIVHIGCDPASFARDVALYVNAGYQLDQVRAFDAFPLTHHVESFALLTRG
ncbi:MAG: class I SAM-dependent RNA methyltransferase, partial [Rhodococcus sp.]|nr:class I SAM-dependent RNA methyltransferase [Rhodococcus sp. (in: high G+C Gram-positive bacteria)]